MIQPFKAIIILIFFLSACNSNFSESKKGDSKEDTDSVMLKNTPGMVLIPKGEFIMGNDQVDEDNRARKTHSSKQWFIDERPKRKVYLDNYYIDKYEVTNKNFYEFILDVSYPYTPKHWINGKYADGKDDHPVVNISWYDAATYAKWAKKKLPSEAHWEKAARGVDGRRFVWGEDYDQKKANLGFLNKGSLKIGSFKEDISPFGVFDMAGNAAEWTSSWYDAYPDSGYTSDLYGKFFKVARGGFFLTSGHIFLKIYAYTTHRIHRSPNEPADNVGFRCIK